MQKIHAYYLLRSWERLPPAGLGKVMVDKLGKVIG